VQRPVVVGASSGSSPPPAIEAKRSQTNPGGLQAPQEHGPALADTALAAPRPLTPPAAPLFGSRPPPGAGSYSVSSSHPPPIERGGGSRTSVERLSPLQSAHPPAPVNNGPTTRRPSPALPVDANAPQIMSRPPALDPEAERWAARFETVPPPAPTTAAPSAEEAPRKRSGRWKTQVMGSMVPLDVVAAREERPPASEPDSYRDEPAVAPVAQAPTPAASTLIHHDVPSGWRPNVDPAAPEVIALRDAVLLQAGGRRLCIGVTGARGPSRGQVASALAFALSQSGARVLLVEADFESPDIHQALAVNAPAGAGFSQQLGARGRNGQPQPWTVVRCSPNLQVLAEGRLRSPGLNASNEFERAIQELREQHHVVIIHAPPLDKPDDLRRIGPLTQAAVLASAGQTPTIQFGENALRALL
jgi:Mrp family chromosome partitioning ATPase